MKYLVTTGLSQWAQDLFVEGYHAAAVPPGLVVQLTDKAENARVYEMPQDRAELRRLIHYYLGDLKLKRV